MAINDILRRQVREQAGRSPGALPRTVPGNDPAAVAVLVNRMYVVRLGPNAFLP